METIIDIVEEGLIEFGSLTCPVVTPERVHILWIESALTYEQFANAWSTYRGTGDVVAKYGHVTQSRITHNAEIYNLLLPVFEQFTKLDTLEGPYYLCLCNEAGDEYLVRRSLPNDKYTKGKFMTLNCQFSKDPTCVPRNCLRRTREASATDGEYLLVVTHVAGDSADREKLKSVLTQHRK
jgi:hypothetical protein